MDKIKVSVTNLQREIVLKDFDGVIYRGIGIVKWLSAGRQCPFAIHLPTGGIISKLSGGYDIEDVKDKIDLALKIIQPDMDYDYLNELLNS